MLNYRRCTALLGFALLCGTGLKAYADQPVHSFYVGPTAGLIDMKLVIDNAKDDDVVYNAGISFGYRFNDYFGMELQYTFTPFDADTFLPGLGADIEEVETRAAYLVFRSPGRVYFKGKLGHAESDIKVVTSDTVLFFFEQESQTYTFSDSGSSYGAAIGFEAGSRVLLELERVKVTENVDYAGFNVNIGF